MNGISRQCIARVHAFIHVHEFWTIIPLKIKNKKRKIIINCYMILLGVYWKLCQFETQIVHSKQMLNFRYWSNWLTKVKNNKIKQYNWIHTKPYEVVYCDSQFHSYMNYLRGHFRYYAPSVHIGSCLLFDFFMMCYPCSFYGICYNVPNRVFFLS